MVIVLALKKIGRLSSKPAAKIVGCEGFKLRVHLPNQQAFSYSRSTTFFASRNWSTIFIVYNRASTTFSPSFQFFWIVELPSYETTTLLGGYFIAWMFSCLLLLHACLRVRRDQRSNLFREGWSQAWMQLYDRRKKPLVAPRCGIVTKITVTPP